MRSSFPRTGEFTIAMGEKVELGSELSALSNSVTQSLRHQPYQLSRRLSVARGMTEAVSFNSGGRSFLLQFCLVKGHLRVLLLCLTWPLTAAAKLVSTQITPLLVGTVLIIEARWPFQSKDAGLGNKVLTSHFPLLSTHRISLISKRESVWLSNPLTVRWSKGGVSDATRDGHGADLAKRIQPIVRTRLV